MYEDDIIDEGTKILEEDEKIDTLKKMIDAVYEFGQQLLSEGYEIYIDENVAGFPTSKDIAIVKVLYRGESYTDE